MFKVLKPINLAILLWLAGLMVLTASVFTNDVPRRLLSVTEMRLAAKGAAPDPENCNANILIAYCTDLAWDCSGLSQAACVNTINCKGCTDTQKTWTVCDINTGPFNYINCKTNQEVGGCGTWREIDGDNKLKCGWVNNFCECQFGKITTTKCTRNYATAETKCTPVP